ncbi:hypothetical protein DBR11_02075 [Pedobacter sp. HMWF019]|uniref:hypothetical protein n=1 Tax=Pedobacter sp. HMWF019 TaxID=2056856 RepID=UPI000D39F3E3|nr:hypothetical protein [Pedobacter sp. HMWF019]PTT03501.1 hypothetical protein DBR11_02075 [Pedobacter sp. HMWF019]
MGNSFHLQDLLMLICCLIAGGLLAWLLYGKTRSLSPKLRIFLTSMRGFGLALVLWLLCAPLVKRISYILEKPVIVIAQDNSLSVGHIEPPGFVKKKYEQDLKQLADQLADTYEVSVYNFSDHIATGFDFSNKGKLTNASALVDKLNDEFLNRNVGAVILATDGIFNRGGNPVYAVNKLKAPVYTIALGDTIPKRDVLISNVNYNNMVYLGSDFSVDVQVQAFESKGEPLTLSVFEGAGKVHEEKIIIDANTFVKNIQVKLKAAKLGSRSYRVVLSPLKNEVSTQNNAQNFVVEVIDDRQKVLIAAAGPHPDLAVLKQAIETNKHFEVKTILNKDLDAVNVNDYGLVILYQLPDRQFKAVPLIIKLQASKRPVWYILGAQTDFVAFNRLQQQVSFNSPGDRLQESIPMVNPDFTTFELNETSKKSIQSYDPLQIPYGQLNVNGVALTMLNQKQMKIGSDVPLWFFMSSGELKSCYLIGEGLWRWKLTEARNNLPETLNQLVLQSVQYLTVKGDKRKFKVYPSKTSVDENESVVLNASLYNDNYQPVNTPDVTVRIRNEGGKVFNFTFSRSEKAYQLEVGLLPPGTYTYFAEASMGGRKYTAEGVFFVNPLFVEYQQTTANHQLLYTISAQTGGKMYGPEDLKNLFREIKNKETIKTLSYEDLKYEELINFKWLFVLILVLLSTEWFVRKRNGLH